MSARIGLMMIIDGCLPAHWFPLTSMYSVWLAEHPAGAGQPKTGDMKVYPTVMVCGPGLRPSIITHYPSVPDGSNIVPGFNGEAKDGQILISSRVARAVEAVARLEDLGELELRGLRRPFAAFNVVQSTSTADALPNLTVIAKEPGV